MKLDEARFLIAILQHNPNAYELRVLPMKIAPIIGIHPNRAHYLYMKWSSKGWYDYGVSARTGWLTESGVQVAREMMMAMAIEA